MDGNVSTTQQPEETATPMDVTTAYNRNDGLSLAAVEVGGINQSETICQNSTTTYSTYILLVFNNDYEFNTQSNEYK